MGRGGALKSRKCVINCHVSSIKIVIAASEASSGHENENDQSKAKCGVINKRGVIQLCMREGIEMLAPPTLMKCGAGIIKLLSLYKINATMRNDSHV